MILGENVYVFDSESCRWTVKNKNSIESCKNIDFKESVR